MELRKTDRGMTIGGGLIVWVATIAAYILSDYQYFSLPFLTMIWHGVLLIIADIFGVLLVASFATVPFTMLVEAYAPDRHLVWWTAFLNMLNAAFVFGGSYLLFQLFAIYLQTAWTNSDSSSEPEIIGTVIAYNCFQSFGVMDDGKEMPLFEMGEMFGAAFTTYDDGRATDMRICDAYEEDDHPCPMDSRDGFNLKISSKSISDEFKITTWEADDGSVFELRESVNEESEDSFVTPVRSGKLFPRTGYSCFGKRTFSLGEVDTEDGAILLTQPIIK